MPARVVVALTETRIAAQIVAELEKRGVDAAAFTASMEALQALEHPHRVEVLVTSIKFPPNTPNGVALARMARHKRPRIKTLFLGEPQLAEHVDKEAEFIPLPIEPHTVAHAVLKLLPDER